MAELPSAAAFRPDPRLRLLIVAAAVVAAACPLFAADGAPDPGFGTNGRVVVGIDVGGTEADVAEAVASYPGGRVVVAGSTVVDSTGAMDVAVVRLLADGSADPSFGTGGMVVYDAGGEINHVVDVLVQPDGKILVLTSSILIPYPMGLVIHRLLPDGPPDPSFGYDGRWSFQTAQDDVEPASLALTATGDIVVGGREATALLGIRLDASGAPQDLGSIEVPNLTAVTDAAMTPDGALILVGSREQSAPDYDMVVGRLTPGLDGDPSFGTNSGYSSVPFDLGGTDADFAHAVGLLADGTIVVVGSADTAHGEDAAILRLAANGLWQPDDRFHVGYYAADAHADWGSDLLVQSDGAVVVLGSVAFDGTLDVDFGVARLRYGGGGWYLDPSYLNGGAFWLPFDVVPGGPDTGIAVGRAGGGVVVAGSALTAIDTTDMAVARLLDSLIFADGFESGTIVGWSTAIGVGG